MKVLFEHILVTRLKITQEYLYTPEGPNFTLRVTSYLVQKSDDR